MVREQWGNTVQGRMCVRACGGPKPAVVGTLGLLLVLTPLIAQGASQPMLTKLSPKLTRSDKQYPHLWKHFHIMHFSMV